MLHLENNPLHKRRGIFEVPIDIVYLNPELALEIMSNVIVVRAEMLLFKDAVEYQAFSKLFEETGTSIAQRYKLIIRKTEDGGAEFGGFEKEDKE